VYLQDCILIWYNALMNKENTLEYKKLRKWNIRAGSLHLLSLIGVVVLANNFSLPVVATYMTGPPGSNSSTGPITLFSVRMAYTIGLFLALSAFFHFFIASKNVFPRYIEGLKNKRNYFRWVEYSLSSTLMIFAIAQLNGISNYATLLAICGVNVSMILFGWLQERYAKPGDKQWLPFIFGCIAGIIPWIIFTIQLITPMNTSSDRAPGFVYGIVISLFLLFNCFAIVQYLQYRAKGKWANYLRGEKAYIILSFVAKSLLAWQIFAGTLAAK